MLLLTQVTADSYLIENLGSLTGLAGTYVLTLSDTDTGTGIVDTDGAELVAGGSETWVVSNTIASFRGYC